MLGILWVPSWVDSNSIRCCWPLPSARGTSLCWLLSWPCVPTSFSITWTLKAGIPWDSVPPNTSFLIPQAHSFVIVAYVTIHAPRIPKFRWPPQFSIPNSWPSYPQRHLKINKPQTELMSSPQPGPVLLFRSHGNGAGWPSRKCEMQTAWPQTNQNNFSLLRCPQTHIKWGG